MDYGTLNDTTENLRRLSEAIETVKSSCNNEILAQTNDQWSKVQDYLQTVIDEIEGAKATLPSKSGAPMEAIASKYGG